MHGKYKLYITALIFTFILVFSVFLAARQRTTDDIITADKQIFSTLPADAKALPRIFPEEPLPTPEAKTPAAPYTPAFDATPSLPISTLEETESVTFIFPVGGNVIAPFSGKALIYSKDMADWRVHSGIDFSANEGEMVLSAANGTIEKVYNDPLFGTTVVIDHQNGFKTFYSSLSAESVPSQGTQILAGDVIGTAANTAACEKSLGTHIHFAVTKDGNYVNPTDYLK